MPKPTVGLAGLGNIGLPLAERLAEGFELHAFDLDPARGAPAGGSRVSSAAALAEAADIVCLCLPSSEAVLSAVREIAEVPAARRRVKIVVEFSTIGVDTAREEAAIAREAGLQFVDAPVSGGTSRARDGTLAIMCAGDKAAIAAAEPVLRQIGKHIFEMGAEPGLGQAMKLANNVISAAALAITSEALIFGERLGLSAEKMIDVINVSTGRTEVSEIKFKQTILPRKYRGAFARVMGKDVNLFLEGVSSAGLDLPVASKTGEVWNSFVAAAPMKDFQMIYEFLRDQAEQQR